MTQRTDPVDTTDGQRDPLTTDDGLSELAQSMPAVDEDRPVGDTYDDPTRDLAPAPGLEITEDGTDPVADLAAPGDTKED